MMYGQQALLNVYWLVMISGSYVYINDYVMIDTNDR